MWSDILGQELEIYIKLPPTYYNNPDRTYLAWYFTDGNRGFPMTAGEKEGAQMSGNISKMAELLQSHNYLGLTVSTCLFPGETHQSCYPASLMRALRVLYKRP
ncbi:MAG: hypothetical protein RBT50_10840 [Bacteroidales bacterium]|nr:hypothetical protein [Bacteroidales bacterium]